jgi:hypothetical protein
MSSHGLLAVLFVAHVLAPAGAVAFVVDVEHREVGHEAVGSGAVPVLLTGLEEHAVTWSHDLDRLATALTQADSLGDADGLAVRMSVPRRPRTRRKVDAARTQARLPRRRCDGVDVDRAGEPRARPGSGLDRVPGDLRDVLPVWGVRPCSASGSVFLLGRSEQDLVHVHCDDHDFSFNVVAHHPGSCVPCRLRHRDNHDPVLQKAEHLVRATSQRRFWRP